MTKTNNITLSLKTLFVFAALLFPSLSNAQSCASTSQLPYQWPSQRNWFFGAGNMWTSQIMNMSTGVITNVGTAGTNQVSTYEGTTAVSSDAGNLLFFSNGRKVWNGAGALKSSAMLEGNEGGATGFNGSAAQGIMTVRHPLDPTKYYVFTTDDANGGTTLGFNYAIFDNTGTLLSGPARLGTFRPTEGITATKHANGVDIWITVCASGSTNFYTYLITCNGVDLVNSPVVSAVASNHSGQGERGGLAFSWDGKYFVKAHPGGTEVSVYQFNKTTGTIYDRHDISSGAEETPYDVLFSPDNTKIYFSNSLGEIWYYDISSWNTATMDASLTKLNIAAASNHAAIEIGPDGNLYQASGNSGSPLRKITGNLNAGGANAFTLTTIAGTETSRGLPTMYLPPQDEPDIQEVGPFCNTDAAVDLSTTWLCTGLNAEDATNYPTAYSGTGITNTGTGIFNPASAAIGSNMIIFKRCNVDDTIWITVNSCSCPDTTLSNIPATCSSGGSISLNTYKVTTQVGTWTITSAPGGSTATITGGNTFNIKNTVAGSYVVRFTLTTTTPGCPTYAERTIKINTKPDITIANKSICSGASTTFDAGAGYTYAWSGLATGTTQTTNASAAGTYTVVVTTTNGCKDTTSATLSLNALPTVFIANKSICAGDATTFDAGNAGATFVWSGLGTGNAQTTAAATAGTYTVTVTNSNNCSASGSATLTINALPIVSVADKSVCSGSSATFDGGTFAGYSWSSGENSQTISKSVAGTYTVTVTDGNGCQKSDAAILAVNALPVVFLGTDKNICPGSSTTLDAGNGFASYSWNTGATSQTLTVSAAGTYTVTVTDGNNCQNSDALVVAINNNLSVNLGPDKAICQDAPAVTFDAGNPGSTYQWNNGSTMQTFSTTVAGTYIVNVTDPNGCAGKDTVVLTENALPVVNLGADKAICLGAAAVTFDAGVFASYAWNTSASSRTISSNTAGNYFVEVTDNNGCKASDTIALMVNALPVVDLGADRSICPGMTTTINAGTCSSYLWNDNSTTSTYSTSAAGAVSVQITDANGCKDSDTVNIIVSNHLTVSLGPDKTICAGDAAVTFDPVITPAIYAWSSGEQTQSIAKTTAGIYSVTVTTPDGCTGKDTVQLFVNALPTPTIANQTICAGDDATFNAGTYSAYKWNDNSTAQNLTVNTAGTYSVEVTDHKGCKNTTSATLTVNALPIITLADNGACEGESATLDAGSGFASYNWSSGENTSSISSSTGGTFTVTVSDGNNCKNSASATITIYPKPSVSLSSYSAVCIDAPNFKLVGGTPAGGKYSTILFSQVVTIDTFNIQLMGQGTHPINYDYIDTHGCSNSAQSAVPVNGLPTVLMSDKTICEGESASFDAGAGFLAYQWNNSATSQKITTSTPGTYTVIVTDGNGCQNSQTAELKINNLPVVQLGPDQSACEGNTVSIASDISSTSYLWNTGATTQSIAVNSARKYSITVTDSNNCKGYDEMQVTFIPMPVFDLGEDVGICAGQTATINSNLNDGKLSWSTGESTKTIEVNRSAEISLMAYYDSNCPVYDTIAVEVIPMPVSTLSADTVVCFRDLSSLTLEAGDAQEYLWDNGTSASSIAVSNEGKYTVTLKNGQNCTVNDTVKIDELCLASLFIPNAFTPLNKDGVNDIFCAKGINVDDFHLMIFNRWGELIYESFDIEEGWDGFYKGELVQIDVYVWKLSWKGDSETRRQEKHEQVGSVTVMK
ncbi:MAG: gliding motility-associated C-terminal domain-containing protein [Flavobacteriales bacterium]